MVPSMVISLFLAAMIAVIGFGLTSSCPIDRDSRSSWRRRGRRGPGVSDTSFLAFEAIGVGAVGKTTRGNYDQTMPRPGLRFERTTGFEPATLTLAT
jgi:hypothetical protein